MSDEPLTIEINGQPITADMATWDRDRRIADREAYEQAQRDAGQVWFAVYWQYHHEYKDEHFSAADAAAALQAGEEYGSLSASGVILPDGSFVADYESLLTADSTS